MNMIKVVALSQKDVYKKWKIILRQYGIMLAFGVLVIIMASLSESFLTISNIMNVILQSSTMGIVAVGATLVIIGGEFDLSVGAVVGFGAALAVGISNQTTIAFAVMVVLLVGAFIGLVNGLIITKLYVNSFLATLGMQLVIRGSMLIYGKGFPVGIEKKAYLIFGQGKLGFIPIPVIIFAGIAAFFSLFLSETTFGRHIYARGGNAEMTRRRGINTDFCCIIAFVISGILSALAGIVLSSRCNVAHPSLGQGYALDVIAAIAIGGTSIRGGEGSILRTVVGILILALISNGLDLLGVNMYFKYCVKGGIIVAAVGFDTYSKMHQI